MIGRFSLDHGNSEELSPGSVRTLLNVANGATANYPNSYLLNRANHTGTQLLVTISDAGDAAGKNVGTTAGTVAAGDDSRITGAAPLNSPVFTGIPEAPTAIAGTNTTQIATTAFVTAAVAAGGVKADVLSDVVSSTNYIGIAPHGSSQSASVWKIFKTVYNSNGSVASHGTATNVKWTDRYTAIYT